jgi:hypothetical protein
MRESVALPQPRLCIGVTGHRTTNDSFARNETQVREAVGNLIQTIDSVAAAPLSGGRHRPRLHSLLAFGADSLVVEEALARHWDVVAPLPFGRELNIAINAHPETVEDARALLNGDLPADAMVAATADRMRRTADQVRLFELADEDERVTTRFLDSLRNREDGHAKAVYSVLASERAAAAGRIMIEQSDLLLAIWDGITPGSVGGTRHTIGVALDEGLPVLWIDVRDPARIVILRDREALDIGAEGASAADIEMLVRDLAEPGDPNQLDQIRRFNTEQWHPRSRRRFHAYRRVEALFGGGSGARLARLVERYETPDRIAEGSGADLLAHARAMPGADPSFLNALNGEILARFAWADGLSTYLSDAYRGGMVLNFLLSACAIVVGVAYLPFASIEWKWPFAAAELLLLLSIVAITTVGRRRRWHGRWFETRRVAEYLRHAPVLLLIGVARTRARWPQGSDATWPELYARQALRGLGVPQTRVTAEYLRAALATLLGDYVRKQRDYHRAKAVRLAKVHHSLDRLSEALFVLAVVAVAAYLTISLGGLAGLIPAGIVEAAAKPFTFLGVALPAIGGACAGIRYFGDFERFSAISKVTAEKLEFLNAKIGRALDGSAGGLCYAQAANLAHAMDDIVVAEIESWQSVFAAKNIAVPV